MRSPAGGYVRLLALALVLAVCLPSTAVAVRRPVPSPVSPVPAALADDKIADLAADLDYDVERIFRFVADEIRYEPYAGILRGAIGTLEAGAGNSMDQALLLAGLLDESLVTYRFAQGTLDDAGARALIDSTRIDTATARAIAEALLVPSGDDERLVAAASSEPPEADAAGLSAMVAEVAESADRQLAETVAMIESALASAGVELASFDVDLPATERDSHTWLQVAQAAEWIDLDPTIPDAVPGAAVASVESMPEMLPDALRHRVTFDVLVERVTGGQLATSSTLAFTAYADELHGVPIIFAHLEPSGAEGLGLALRALSGAGMLRYTPLLQVGDQAFVGDEGIEFGVGASEDDEGLFSDSELLDAGPSGEALADGEATAEWLEIRVESPGADPVVARRTVFDRLPAEVRFGGQPSSEDVLPPELLVVDETGSPDLAPLLGVEAFAIATATMNAEKVLEAMTDAEPDPTALLALAYHPFRDAIATQAILDQGIRTYVAGPNVVSFSIDVGEIEDSPVVALGLDVWHRALGTLPTDEPSAAGSNAQLVAGVLAQVAELAALQAGGALDDPSLPAPVSVRTVFEAAAAAGVPIRVLAGEPPGDLPYGAAADTLIGEALAAGDVLVIPAEPVDVNGRLRVGWWRVDPVSGAATDSMDDGSGSQVTESTVTVSRALKVGRCFVAIVPAVFTAMGLYGAYNKNTEAATVSGLWALLYSQVLPKLKYFDDLFPPNFKC